MRVSKVTDSTHVLLLMYLVPINNSLRSVSSYCIVPGLRISLAGRNRVDFPLFCTWYNCMIGQLLQAFYQE